MADYNFLLETRLSQDQQMALKILQHSCRGAGLNVYLTGGPMRDLLTGKPVRFLECTTEGNPERLAPDLKAAGAERLNPLPEHRGLVLSLRGCRMRILAVRDGNGGTIIEDLRRRGLTLNSIGLSLNPGSRGLPLDPTNGAADIEAGLIRMNHSYVFLEDPIVVLRAMRLHSRLGFAIEERTAARMLSAREGNYLESASAASRGQELEAIAYEPDPALVLLADEREGWLEAAYGKGVKTSKMNMAALARLGAVVDSWELLGVTVDSGLLAMPLMLAGLSPADQTRLGQMVPSRHLGTEWKKLPAAAHAFEKQLLGVGARRQVQELIEKTAPEAVAYAALEPSDNKAAKRLQEFQAEALLLRQRLPLGILRAQGLAPHSQEAETILRPYYRRLLSGEALSDAELAEGLRAATQALRPPPPASEEPAPSAKTGRGKPATKAAAPPPAAKSAVPAPAAPKPVAEAQPAKPAAPSPSPSQPAPKPATKSATKSATKPTSKPPPKPIPKPASKAAPKPASKPAAKSVSKPAAKLASKAASKPALKSVKPKPAAKASNKKR